MPNKLKKMVEKMSIRQDNTRVVRNDTLKTTRRYYSPYGSLPTREMQREQRMSNRPKPVVAKAGVTLTNRRYRNGGKTKY